MDRAPVVDVHVHLSETAEIGASSTAAYEIWEYGSKPDVRFGRCDGDLDGPRRAMRTGGIDHAVVVNAISIDEWRDRRLAGPDSADGDSSGDDRLEPLAARLIGFNEWLVDAVSPFLDITALVLWTPGCCPWAMRPPISRTCDGARGVKIHPVEQRFSVADPGVRRLFEACADLDLTILAHSGPTRHGPHFAELATFAEALTAVPRLRLVVAYLGGASWRQTGRLAADHPNVTFDLSEIVAWVGAPQAPTPAELVGLIREIDVERVMFGSDFPWYEPGEMVQAVRDLPGLSAMECTAIPRRERGPDPRGACRTRRAMRR